MALVKKLFGHFSTHYLSEVFGHHALMHEHMERPSGRELVVRQRQKKLHVSHVARLSYFEYRGVTTPYKQCRVYMLDESEAKRVNNTSILSTARKYLGRTLGESRFPNVLPTLFSPSVLPRLFSP